LLKVYFKKVTEISSKTAKKVSTVPKTVHYEKVSTLPITVLKTTTLQYRGTKVPWFCPPMMTFSTKPTPSPIFTGTISVQAVE